MADILIRNLSERTITRLKKRARHNERSLQAELQIIVERAAEWDIIDSREAAEKIRRKLSERKR